MNPPQAKRGSPGAQADPIVQRLSFARAAIDWATHWPVSIASPVANVDASRGDVHAHESLRHRALVAKVFGAVGTNAAPIGHAQKCAEYQLPDGYAGNEYQIDDAVARTLGKCGH